MRAWRALICALPALAIMALALAAVAYGDWWGAQL